MDIRGIDVLTHNYQIEPLKVMLVDDDDTVRDALSELLGCKGWDVESYCSAEDAVDAVARNGKGFDVVVTDINMPGLSGMDFLNRVKAASPDTPVVMITGYPSIDMAVDAMKSGASNFLTKPFKMEELEIVIRNAADSAKALGGQADGEDGAGRDERVIGKLPVVARRRLEDKIKELSIMHTIAETLDEVHSKEDVFRKTLDMAQIIADADSSFIMVVEPEKKEAVVRAASGYRQPTSLIGRRFPLEFEPFQSVVKTRTCSLSTVDEPALAPLMSPEGGVVAGRPLLVAPLLINREAVVLLGICTQPHAGTVTPETLTLIVNLAAKAALKIENIALTENMFSSIIASIHSLINALDARDTYTKDHSHRVTQYAIKIAGVLECRQEIIDSLSFAGPLHDIGKIGVRDDVLLKQGSFTPAERDIMMTHVVMGEEILRPLNLLASEKAIVLSHHERWDGQGYPYRLKGEEIPLVARVFSVADTFDAMTSTRPYRKALSADVARDEIIRCAGTQFDPLVADAFLKSDIVAGLKGKAK